MAGTTPTGLTYCLYFYYTQSCNLLINDFYMYHSQLTTEEMGHNENDRWQKVLLYWVQWYKMLLLKEPVFLLIDS